MKTHIQIVAALHIAMGVLTLLGAICVFLFMGMAAGIVVSNGEPGTAGITGLLAIVIAGFLTLLALPSIIGGVALLTGRAWARPLVLVLGALHLLNVPIGTALGIYTFWALLHDPQTAAAPHGVVQSVA